MSGKIIVLCSPYLVVHEVLLNVGRPREDAGGAPQLAGGGDLARDRGWPGSVLDAVDEQRLPRPVSRRQDPAGGEPNRVRPGPIVLDAGRQATSC
jgi:hypothetical protein